MTKPGQILYQLSGEVMVPLKVLHVEKVMRQGPDGENFADNVVKMETPEGQILEDFHATFFYVPFIPEIEAELLDGGKLKAA